MNDVSAGANKGMLKQCIRISMLDLDLVNLINVSRENSEHSKYLLLYNF